MHMMKGTANLLGIILCLTGLIGFFDQHFWKMVLNPLHDGMLIVLGVISLYYGIQGTEHQARNMCRFLGIVFGILGLWTLFSAAGVATAADVNIPTHHLLTLIPGRLEYSTSDGVRDLIVGIIGLIFGFMPRKQERELETSAERTKEKVSSRI